MYACMVSYALLIAEALEYKPHAKLDMLARWQERRHRRQRHRAQATCCQPSLLRSAGCAGSQPNIGETKNILSIPLGC